MRQRPALLLLCWGAHVQNGFLQAFLYQFGCRAQRLRLVAEARDPMHLRLATEPSQLPLGVVAMSLLGGFYRRRNTQSPRQDGQSLPVTQRVQRLHRPIAFEQAARLFDQSGRKDSRRSPIEPVVEALAGRKRLARRVEADAQQPETGEQVASQYFGKWLAHSQADLDGANQLGCIVRVNARSRGRVEPPEHLVQPSFAVPLAAAL